MNNSLVRAQNALRGTRVLVVGGDPRAKAILKLKLELGISEVVHCPTRPSDASDRCFRHALFHPELVLVICCRGLTRTNHGDRLHRVCRQLGLPWLDCDKIPHANQLLHLLSDRHLIGAIERRKREVSFRKGGAA